MSLDQTKLEGSISANSRPISTIDEDFYNTLRGSYISDDEESNDGEDNGEDNGDDHISEISDTTDPMGSPGVPKHLTFDKATEISHTTPELPPLRNISTSTDVLLLSERSKESKDSSSKRDNSDKLLTSERSGGTYPSVSRRDASGYDSLLVSETTDETWRKRVAFHGDNDHGDDASSLSSMESTPFPHLVDDGNNSFITSSPAPEASPSGHDAETAKKSGKGANWDVVGAHRGNTPRTSREAPPAGSMSDLIDVIKKPPLTSSSAPDPPATTDTAEAKNMISECDDDVGEEESLTGEGIEKPSNKMSLRMIKKPSNKMSLRMIDRYETFEADIKDEPGQSNDNDNDNHNNFNGEEKSFTGEDIEADIKDEPGQSNDNHNHDNFNVSISTLNSLRESGHIPRRWIFDRIDGTVKIPEEEGERLPLWKRRPPSFFCLPSPLLGLFPWFFEENPFCVAIGKYGFFGGDGAATDDNPKNTTGSRPQSSNNGAATNPSANDHSTDGNKIGFRRSLVILHSLLLNACGLFATILSGLSLTRSNPGLLEASTFSKSAVIPALTSSLASSGSVKNTATLYLGLLVLGVKNPQASVGGTILVPFRDFCTTPGMEQFVLPDECDKCDGASVWIVLGFFLAVAAYFPTFGINIGRIYTNYDANCSKVAAGLWSLVSLLGYVMVLSAHHFSCLGSLYAGEVPYTSEGEAIGGEILGENDDQWQDIRVASFDWTAGVGQIMFQIGIFLKLIDFVTNCCVATPAITRSRDLQWEYEEGLLLHGENLENGMPSDGSASLDRTQGGDGVMASDEIQTEQSRNV